MGFAKYKLSGGSTDHGLALTEHDDILPSIQEADGALGVPWKPGLHSHSGQKEKDLKITNQLEIILLLIEVN